MTAVSADDFLRQYERLHLLRLQRWLNFEVSTPLLMPVAWFMPVRWVVMGLQVAAVLFVPVLVHTLLRLGAYRWLAGLAVPILMLLFTVLSTKWDNPYVAVMRGILPLLLFYGYCWLLRHRVERWLLDRPAPAIDTGL